MEGWYALYDFFNPGLRENARKEGSRGNRSCCPLHGQIVDWPLGCPCWAHTGILP